MLSQLSEQWKKKFLGVKEAYKQVFIQTKKLFCQLMQDLNKSKKQVTNLESLVQELREEVKYTHKSHKKFEKKIKETIDQNMNIKLAEEK
mmetsp:Transcript_15097/g.13251  ORF Transcript_15097/g.13251 Transcript_15097/m.13251 type:complete len:90 (-) Transcript_15097:94-363(-)